MRKNHHGFSVIELVLVVGVVCLLGLIGWYAIHTRSKYAQTTRPNAVSTSTPKNTNTNSSPGNTTTQTQPTQSAPSYTPKPLVTNFPISQWNIRFKTAQDLNKLTYQVIEHDRIGFSYSGWEALDTNCAASKGGAGVLSRYDESSLSADDSENIKARADAKLGNYYYVYEAPQAPCSQNEQIISEQTATQFSINLRNSIHTSLESL